MPLERVCTRCGRAFLPAPDAWRYQLKVCYSCWLTRKDAQRRRSRARRKDLGDAQTA